MDTANLLIKAGANPQLTDKVRQKKNIEKSLSHCCLVPFLFQEGQKAERVAAASGHREVYQLLNSLTGEPEVPVENITELKVSSRRQSFSREFGGLTISKSLPETEVCSCGLNDFEYYTFPHTVYYEGMGTSTLA